MADYKTPQWLLPNEKNLAYPAAGAETGSGLSEDRHSLYSMDFTGSNTINYSTPVDLGVVSTFSFWMNIDVGTTGALFGNTALGTFEYVVYYSGSQFLFKIAGAYADFPNAAAAISTGQWHHVAFVRPSENEVKCYIDSVLTDTITSWSGTPGSNPIKFDLIGSRPGGGLSYSGKIDEICGFKRALSGTEVAALSVADAPANVMALPDKPYVYYPLGEQAQMGSANWSFPNGSLQSHAVSFDGSTDYISAGNVLDQSGTDAFSISSWFYLNSGGSNTIVSKMNSSFVGYQLYINAANKLKFLLQGTGNLSATGNTTLSLNTWYNVILTYDGSGTTGGINLYLNGVTETFVGSGSNSGGVSNSENFEIGARTGAIDVMDGKLSNVAFWNSDQSTNIDNIYNNGSPQSTYTATPTAWWKLNAANSSYVYPWSLELNGSPDVSGGEDFAKVVSNALQVQDINTTGTSGKVDFLTREITGAYSGIDVTGEFIVYAASSGQSGATLYYKIDGGSWVQFQQELRTDNTATTYAISGASGLTSTTSFQVKIEFETGDAGSASVTLNNISIGDLYTEDFTNQDGAGWDNNTYTPPPVDWTFIDTETPAPNYTSALNFDGTVGEIALTSPFVAAGEFTLSLWINPDNVVDNNFLGNGGAGSNWLQIKTASQIKIKIASSTVIAFTESGGNNLTASAWNHILIYRDSSNNVGAYVNGKTFGSAGSNTSTLTLSTIGRATSIFFEGDISNTAFWTSDQSANVATLYNGGTPETAISFSPTSWWKLDNTTTGIQDSGSASNNGTNNGATQIATNVLIPNNGESDTLPTSALTPSDLQFESPYSNYSLSFDGIGNYIDCGNDSSLQFSGSFTISAWVKINDSGTNAIVSKNSSSSSGNGYHIDFRSGNSVHAWAYNANNKVIVTGLSTGIWYNVVFVFESTGGSNGNQSLYVNAATPSTNSITNFSVSTIKNLRIGDSEAISSTEMNGNIDEVSIWNTALTQAQVIQVYNNGYPNDLTSLSPSQWWRLGEDAYFVGNDITIPNQISSGQTGTGAGTQTAILVGDAPGSYANGSGTNLVVGDRIGDAPESTANSVSINMIPSNRISYPAGYVPTQVDNVYSMAFDGVSNSKFNVNPPTIGSDNTISAWAKRVGTGNMFLLGNTSSGGYGCYFVGTSGVYVQGSGGYFAFTNSAVTTAMVRTDWVNWVFIKNSSAGTVSVYVDGELAQSASSTGGMDSLTSIGGSGLPTGSQFPWNGNIDEVAVFNYILSERQIKQDIYEGTTAGGKTADLNNISNLTAPIAWYRMGD